MFLIEANDDAILSPRFDSIDHCTIVPTFKEHPGGLTCLSPRFQFYT